MGMPTPLLAKLARSTLDLVFPVHCCGCGREGGIICAECADGLERLVRPYCGVCAAPGVSGTCQWCLQDPKAFDSLRSPYRFQGSVREAIHALKYRGVRVAAGPLADLLTGYLARNPVSVDVVVPAPLHPRRLRSRGYNQSALLARGVAAGLGIPLRETLLLRVTDSRPQVEARNRDDRRANVIGGFTCPEDVRGVRVLLIDDVATTGSTLSECARVLKAAGAPAVYALALAREG